MTVKRGDVVLARVPHTAGTRGKRRPAVVIQANVYNATLRHVIVAEVTSNPRWVGDPACVFIDIATPEGKTTGLHQNGVVSCLHLVTMNADRLGPPIGNLPPALMQKLNDSLKVALELP
jgi:mRNA interferase MazF